MQTNTIAAIATAPGVGGIACVRISGEKAYDIAEKVFVPIDKKKQIKAAKGYTAMYGHFYLENKKCDEAVALFFRAPKSYTGEEVVEISCHGGSAVSNQLLRACIDAGAMPADKGEFTKRAFLNGRINLTQAEAVMDMVNATGKQAAAAASAAMDGALYKKGQEIAKSLITIAGHIAAYTDFPEEDVEELDMDTLCSNLQSQKEKLENLIKGYERGAIIRRGVDTAIVGSPNVGKSTLLNLLSGYEKAIVTPIAGTTRDIVEQEIILGGIKLLLADTAGIRATNDIVESEGIRRSLDKIEKAQLVLAVFDGSKSLSEDDKMIAEKCKDKVSMCIINKNDLVQNIETEKLKPYFSQLISITANSSEEISKIENEVLNLLGVNEIEQDSALLANERQLSCAKNAYEAICEGLAALQGGYTLDAVGVCIDDALNSVYSLTGENASEAVIEEVFSKFCVGK